MLGVGSKMRLSVGIWTGWGGYRLKRNKRLARSTLERKGAGRRKERAARKSVDSQERHLVWYYPFDPPALLL
jgi:hypothetical protein